MVSEESRKNKDDAPKSGRKTHIFWDTQPIPKSDGNLPPEQTLSTGPIENKDIDSVQTNPIRLPKGFYWSSFDIKNEEISDEFFTFLNDNYIEDKDHSFRFKYEKRFLDWALCPPGYNKEWHIAIRAAPKGQMLASITGVPVTLMVHDKEVKAVEVNFLCIHKKIRTKRLAPVLIKEITRRANLEGYWQAVYTIGTELTMTFSKNRYFHRQLNPRKLVEINFTSHNPKLQIGFIEKQHKLPGKPSNKLRKIEERDVRQCTQLINDFLQKYKIRIVFSEELFAHFFLPLEKVVQTFVIENERGEIENFLSFYLLSSSVLNNPKFSEVKAAYSFYNVAMTVSLESLLSDALILAKQEGCDVFNALDIMDNRSVFKNLKFKEGDGVLHYYLYNYYVEPMDPRMNSLIFF